MRTSPVESKSFRSHESLLTLRARMFPDLCISPDCGGSSELQHPLQTELWRLDQELIHVLPAWPGIDVALLETIANWWMSLERVPQSSVLPHLCVPAVTLPNTVTRSAFRGPVKFRLH